MKMKIAAAFTVALVAVIGLAVAQDFNNFNNFGDDFNDFGDDNSAFFGGASFAAGPAFGGASLAAGPSFGGVGGGFASPAFVPLPAPQQAQGSGGIGLFLPIFFLFFILFLRNNILQDNVVVINSTLQG